MSTTNLDLKSVQFVGDCTINDLSVECQDAAAIAEYLKDKEYGYGVTIKIAPELRQKMYSGVKSAAAVLGFGIATKSTREGLRIFKHEPRDIEAKVREMAELRSAQGMTLSEVGKRFGVTRERVRQLTSSVKKFSSNSQIGAVRTKEFLEFSKPFIDAVQDSPSCIVCLRSDVGIRKRGVCKECGSLVDVLTQTAGCIRRYRRGGTNQDLSNAVKNIRKYNLKPEDLELM